MSIGVDVYEYSPSSPLEFQQEDILGVYYGGTIRRVVEYNQDSTGPKNYYHPDRLFFSPTFLTAPVLASEYDYPLVTVVISKSTHYY